LSKILTRDKIVCEWVTPIQLVHFNQFYIELRVVNKVV